MVEFRATPNTSLIYSMSPRIVQVATNSACTWKNCNLMHFKPNLKNQLSEFPEASSLLSWLPIACSLFRDFGLNIWLT